MDAVCNVGRYLLTVRAEYFFLAVLHFSILQDHPRVEQEQLEFTRFVYIYKWYKYMCVYIYIYIYLYIYADIYI